MVERVIKATTAGWRPWAIVAAAVSMGAAAVLVWRQRSQHRSDGYEEWWRHREEVRANGHKRSGAEHHRAHNLQLFI